jgi:membrane fusion protein, multidrug efflux system
MRKMKIMNTKHPFFCFNLAPPMVVAGVYALALASAAVIISVCGAKPAETTIRPSPVKTTVALATNAAQIWEYAGEIKPRYETTLSFRVAGKVSDRLVNLGDAVTSTSVVARLDAADLKLAAMQAIAEVDRAKSQAKLADADLVRYRDLFSRDLIARAELENREASATAAKATLDALQAAAGRAGNAARYGSLMAGSAGIVTAVMVEAGQVVTAGQPVVQIAQTQQIEAAFAVPETQIRNFETGQAVVVRVLDSEAPRTGRIREIAGMTDPVSRTYSVRVQFTDASKVEAFRLGMSARVTVQKNPPATAGNASELPSFVPLSAIVGEGTTNFVLVVTEGKAIKRPVKMHQVAQGNLVSVSGVTPGETVVAAGAPYVTPGSAVSSIPAKENSL